MVFYNKQSQTNAELDAITEGVIADLRALQLAVDTREEVIDNRAELTRHLRELLEKLLSPRREQLIRLKIQKIQRRIVTLFFESEIYTDIVMESRNVYSHADEALYHVLKKNEHDLLLSLDGLQYEKPEIYEAAVQQLLQFQKRLVNAVLSRSKPELERLLHVYRDVLLVFLMRDFRAEIPAFAHQVIAESNVAAMGGPSYKIRHDAFPAFRAAFETRFLQSLLDGLHEPLTRRLDGSGEETFREETMVFASNPQIYATVCEIVCNTLYEFMHGEGYLDLPVTWQRSLYDG